MSACRATVVDNNCIFGCIQATKAGADEALMLDPHGFVVEDGVCYYLANGDRIYATTARKTALVVDLNATDVSHLTPIGGGRFVYAADGGNDKGIELWLTDGTSAGTRVAVPQPAPTRREVANPSRIRRSAPVCRSCAWK